MNRRRSGQPLWALSVGLFACCAIVLLVALRPSLPSLPRSLSDPVTVAEIESMAGLLAWLTLLALVALLLCRALRSARRSTVPLINGAQLGPQARLSGRALASRPLRGSEGVPGRAARHEQPVFVVTATEIEPPRPELAVRQSARGEDAVGRAESEASGAVAISVLGPLRIENGGSGRPKLRASAGELIAYLVLHPEGASRDQLLDALWPGDNPRRSEQRLWQSTSQARKLVGDGLSRDRDHYQLARTKVRVDLDEFEQLLAQAQQSPDGSDRRGLFERAAGLIHGEPLAGSDYPWADGHIRRIRATILELLEHVGRARLAAGETRGALQAAEQGLAIDVLNEGLWQLALQAEATLGHRESVVERYQTLTRILDERLGLEPNRDTRALYLTALAQL